MKSAEKIDAQLDRTKARLKRLRVERRLAVLREAEAERLQLSRRPVEPSRQGGV